MTTSFSTATDFRKSLEARLKNMDLDVLKKALKQVFNVRGTHPLPKHIDSPPYTWEIPFNELAKECALTLSLDEAFREVAKIYMGIG